MTRRLDMLVPHWDETPDEMRPLLDSIAIQQSIDFADVGVIIAYDGPDATALPLDEWRERYPFAIEDVHPEKGGVSATRNAALDASEAEFVIFADADDMLLTVNALYTVLQLTETNPFDTLVSCFMEEQKTDDVREKMAQGSKVLEATFGPQYRAQELPEFMYIPHEMDSTFVHGKVHRRSYLIDRNIRFDPRLTVHEDSYFNILAQQLCDPDRAKYWPQPFYLWKWRDNSVCRHDPQYLLKTFNNMLQTTDALIDQFVKRGYEEKAKAFTASTVYDTYYTMNKPEWTQVNNAEYRRSTEAEFARWFEKHHWKWDALDPQVRMVISEQQRQRHVAEGMLSEALTIEQWLGEITGKRTEVA